MHALAALTATAVIALAAYAGPLLFVHREQPAEVAPVPVMGEPEPDIGE